MGRDFWNFMVSVTENHWRCAEFKRRVLQRGLLPVVNFQVRTLMTSFTV